MRCKIQSFEEWLLEVNDDSSLITQFKESKLLSELIRSPNNETLSSCLEELEKEVFELYERFQNEIQNEFGPTPSFWNSYLDMVQTLLDYQRSLRTGDWNLHLRATEKMLPWFHAYDHFNYARHFTYYWCTQQNLGDTHTGLHQAYLNQHFSAKKTVGRFNRLPADQVIEQTINKEQKGKGSIIGSSASEGTVQRWILKSHIVASLMTDLKESIGLQINQRRPKELGEKRIEYDEMKAQKRVSLIEEWSNPFQRAEEFVSLSSGQQVPEDVKQDLLNARKIGEKQLKEFIDNRILSDKVGFYESIKRLKLKTFTSLKVKKTTKVKGKEHTIELSLKTFSKFIILQEKRNISIREVLNYELGALPLSIAVLMGAW